jgi:hypothetical protein
MSTSSHKYSSCFIDDMLWLTGVRFCLVALPRVLPNWVRTICLLVNGVHKKSDLLQFSPSVGLKFSGLIKDVSVV